MYSMRDLARSVSMFSTMSSSASVVVLRHPIIDFFA